MRSILKTKEVLNQILSKTKVRIKKIHSIFSTHLYTSNHPSSVVPHISPPSVCKNRQYFHAWCIRCFFEPIRSRLFSACNFSMILFKVKMVFSISKVDFLEPRSCNSLSNDLGVESDDFSTFNNSMYLNRERNWRVKYPANHPLHLLGQCICNCRSRTA